MVLVQDLISIIRSFTLKPLYTNNVVLVDENSFPVIQQRRV
jgi:hypothetical protein